MSVTSPYRIPSATYRLQFNAQFTFQDATEIADYLHELGISDCYASPLFRAGPQSTHGYDTCGLDELDPKLGGLEGFERFTARLRQLGLGLLVDMVPNHMGADLSNGWWLDVLEKGQDSPFANWFDIDWQSPHPGLGGKVLLPILEAPYAEVLEAGELRLVIENERLALAYHDRRLPLKLPKSLSALGHSLTALNGTPGTPESFDRLHALLQQQHYRLAFWRTGPEEINYRRFFDIVDLVSLRIELPEVFEATHRLLLQLIQHGKISGLRVDHPDGLWDPKEYFERLQRACASSPGPSSGQTFYVVAEKILTGDEALPSDWPVAGTTGYDFLNRVNGLFVNGANQSALDRIYREFTGEQCNFSALLQACKRQVLGTAFIAELNALISMLEIVAAGTRYGVDITAGVLRDALIELLVCFPVYRGYATEQTVELSPSERAFITEALNRAKKQTHVSAGAVKFIGGLLRLDVPRDLNDEGRKVARQFVMKFQQLSGPLMAKGLEDTAFYNFNRLISLNEVGGDPGRFGIEPDRFHAYNLANAEDWPHTLLATATHDTKRGEDHRARINVLSEMPQQWHDAVLRWQKLNANHKTAVGTRRVPEANDEYLLYQTLIGTWTPELQESDACVQFTERIAAYMLKATREAKAHTSWRSPDAAYEQATRQFVERLLLGPERNAFLSDFTLFQRKISFFGRFNSLAQMLIKMTAPGVPDFYQGTELWDFTLVDPDNRRPVDFERRRKLLFEIKSRLPKDAGEMPAKLKQLLEESESGQIKLYLMWSALQLRRKNRHLYDRGAYLPLTAVGSKADHVFAFARALPGEIGVTVAPRLTVGLTEGVERAPVGRELWRDTRIAPMASGGAKGPDSGVAVRAVWPGARYRNVLTGEFVEAGPQGLLLGEVLACFPVALLELAG